MALSRPDVELVAITCVSGNVEVDQVAVNTLRVLQVCNRLDVSKIVFVSLLAQFRQPKLCPKTTRLLWCFNFFSWLKQCVHLFRHILHADSGLQRSCKVPAGRGKTRFAVSPRSGWHGGSAVLLHSGPQPHQTHARSHRHQRSCQRTSRCVILLGASQRRRTLLEFSCRDRLPQHCMD